MLERHVEDHFCAVVASLGGETRKVKWVGRRGANDRLALFPEGTVVAVNQTGGPENGWHCLVELKRPKGPPPRLNQLREHKKLRAGGFEIWVLGTIEEIDDWGAEISGKAK